MTVAKAVLRGVLILGWLGSSAHGGPMLVLGVFSNQPAPALPSPTAPAIPAWSGDPAPLSLGSVSNAASPPAQVFNPAPAPAPTPEPAPSVVSPPTASYDATINFGAGPYPNAGGLTTGNPLPWYLSRPVDALYGGVPNAQQQADFENAVIQRVGQAFRLSGVPISLTDDPNAGSAHTISVVSNSTNPTSSQAIGMTYLGGNGFHYIDQSAPSANTVDQLEWIVAHNVSHELMLAFGVPEVHDTSGNYIDARNANWSMMVNPNAQFSTGAVADLLSRDFRSPAASSLLMGAQLLNSEPVPEPSTIALWALGASAAWVALRKRARKA